jgi:hypothetical protein
VGQYLAESIRMQSQPLAGHELFLHQHTEHRGQEPRVCAGFYLQVDVGQFGALGAARVHYDEAAGRILGDLPQRDACARNAMGHPGVLAKEKCDLAVVEVSPRIEPDHLCRDPELAGFLLG